MKTFVLASLLALTTVTGVVTVSQPADAAVQGAASKPAVNNPLIAPGMIKRKN
jgi:hypothetical protein